jgi:hypothetical protein
MLIAWLMSLSLQRDCLPFGERGSSLPRPVTLRLLASAKSPRGHVILHHGALLQLVPNTVCMIWIGCVEKLLEVIRWLSRLTFKITLGNGNELLIGVAGVLIVITFVATGGDHHTLGPPPEASFPLLHTKMAPTASSPEACLVAMSRSSFVVFGWSRPSLCTRDQQFMLDQNIEMTSASQILVSSWHFQEKCRM